MNLKCHHFIIHLYFGKYKSVAGRYQVRFTHYCYNESQPGCWYFEYFNSYRVTLVYFSFATFKVAFISE